MSLIRSTAPHLAPAQTETPADLESSLGLSALSQKIEDRAAWKRLHRALADIESNLSSLKRDVGEMQSTLGGLKREILSLRNSMLAYGRAWKVNGSSRSPTATH